VTTEEYQRICDRLARKAVRYAAVCPKCTRPPGAGCVFTTSGQEAPEGFVHNERAVTALDIQSEHWIYVFMDEHMPDIDPDVLLEVTSHADAWDKAGGHRYAGKEVRAIAAFQADVWDAINRTEIP